jgi:hypothetical protein
MLPHKSPKPSHTHTTLPLPTPTSWPWNSHVLRHIKFARSMGLSFHWWTTRSSSATYAARDTSSGGYWLVHIVVPHNQGFNDNTFSVQSTPPHTSKVLLGYEAKPHRALPYGRLPLVCPQSVSVFSLLETGFRCVVQALSQPPEC